MSAVPIYLILRDDGAPEGVYASTDEAARDQALLELLLGQEAGVRYTPDVLLVGDRAVVDHLIETANAERCEAVYG
jgi:hypothetical protein